MNVYNYKLLHDYRRLLYCEHGFWEGKINNLFIIINHANIKGKLKNYWAIFLRISHRR